MLNFRPGKPRLASDSPPYTATHVFTQTAAALRLTTFSPVEIVGAGFGGRKKAKVCTFLKGRHDSRVMFPKKKSLVFRAGCESHYFRRGNRRVVAGHLEGKRQIQPQIEREPAKFAFKMIWPG